MTTNNVLDVNLSGATGTVNFVGATSATLITPTLGAATATSLTFNPTTSGMVGTTTNDNASAGIVGQSITSVILIASAVTFTTGVTSDLTSIALTAGDWDVWGNYRLGATTIGQCTFWINNASVTLPDSSVRCTVAPLLASTAVGMDVPYQRFSLSGNTTIYISGQANFSGTGTVCGGIYARRAR
jgi:hypothetical protein